MNPPIVKDIINASCLKIKRITPRVQSMFASYFNRETGEERII
jgi:hypothetical protein